jgi:hypothetical protein
MFDVFYVFHIFQSRIFSVIKGLYFMYFMYFMYFSLLCHLNGLEARWFQLPNIIFRSLRSWKYFSSMDAVNFMEYLSDAFEGLVE